MATYGGDGTVLCVVITFRSKGHNLTSFFAVSFLLKGRSRAKIRQYGHIRAFL